MDTSGTPSCWSRPERRVGGILHFKWASQGMGGNGHLWVEEIVCQGLTASGGKEGFPSPVFVAKQTTSRKAYPRGCLFKGVAIPLSMFCETLSSTV